MATQQIEFVAAGGLTLTAALYAAGNDTAAYTASAVVEQTNRTGVYRATFSSVAAGTYQLIAKSGSMTVASWWGFAQDVAQTFTFGELAGSLGQTSISSAAFSAGAIDAAAIATDALGSLELSAGAASEIASAVRTELATELGRVDASISSRLATASYTAPLDALGTRSAVGLASANLDSQLNTISGGVSTLLGRIPATLFAGITYLSRWLGALAGKTADTATRAEINATTGGTTYNETTDSLQAISDANSSGGGGLVNANVVSANGHPVLVGDLNFAVSAGGKMVNNVLELVPGDEYIEADDTAITFTDSRFPDLDLFTSGKLTVYVNGVAVIDHVSTASLDDVTKTISVELTEAQTSLLAGYVGEDAFFDLELVRADATRKTVARGPANLLDPLG